MTKQSIVFYDDFKIGDVTVRMTMRDGKPWFVAKDVFEGFNVPEVCIFDEGVDTISDFTNEHLVSEKGLYVMMLLGRTEGAKKFQKWLLEDVMSAIRVHGKFPAE